MALRGDWMKKGVARICLEEVRGNVERGKREFEVGKKVF